MRCFWTLAGMEGGRCAPQFLTVNTGILPWEEEGHSTAGRQAAVRWQNNTGRKWGRGSGKQPISDTAKINKCQGACLSFGVQAQESHQKIIETSMEEKKKNPPSMLSNENTDIQMPLLFSLVKCTLTAIFLLRFPKSHIPISPQPTTNRGKTGEGGSLRRQPPSPQFKNTATWFWLLVLP